ncbi:MAG: hypothetical protein ABI723_19590 [Bacteroidia bacterium]
MRLVRADGGAIKLKYLCRQMQTDKEKIIKLIEPLLWDTTVTPEQAYHEFIKEGNNSVKHDLYIKLLNFYPWRKIRKSIPMERWGELLNDKVIIGLFPRQHRQTYFYVKRVLLG